MFKEIGKINLSDFYVSKNTFQSWWRHHTCPQYPGKSYLKIPPRNSNVRHINIKGKDNKIDTNVPLNIPKEYTNLNHVLHYLNTNFQILHTFFQNIDVAFFILYSFT